MTDFDQRTGAPLDNYASALQSVEILFSTRLADRVMLREFGAGLLELLGRSLTAKTIVAFTLLLASAIDIWEPRFRVRRVNLTGSVDEIRLGTAGFLIEVDWRPRAHLGDATVESVTTFGIERSRVVRTGQ